MTYYIIDTLPYIVPFYLLPFPLSLSIPFRLCCNQSAFPLPLIIIILIQLQYASYIHACSVLDEFNRLLFIFSSWYGYVVHIRINYLHYILCIVAIQCVSEKNFWIDPQKWYYLIHRLLYRYLVTCFMACRSPVCVSDMHHRYDIIIILSWLPLFTSLVSWLKYCITTLWLRLLILHPSSSMVYFFFFCQSQESPSLPMLLSTH